MSFTYQEIESQPDVWRSVVNHFFETKDELTQALKHCQFSRIVVIGCGSTYYLSRSAAQLLNFFTKCEVHVFPSSEAWLLSDLVSSQAATLLLAISRSGTTTETIRAVEKFRANGGQNVMVITCFPESPLAQLADIVISADQAQEKSVVQTRSFTSMYLLAAGLAGVLGDQPELLAELQLLPGELEIFGHELW